MDFERNEINRRLHLAPDDPELLESLVRHLARAGRLYDARKVLERRLASRSFSLAELESYVQLSKEAGFSSSGSVRASKLMNFSALFQHRGHGPTEVHIEIGFASIAGGGAQACVLALADFFGESVTGFTGSGLYESNEAPLPETVAADTSFEFSFELQRPLVLSRRFSLRSLRVLNLPSSPHKRSLRRRLLRSINALAFVADTRSDGSGETNESVFRRINADFEELWDRPLDHFRTLVQVLEPTSPELDRALRVALGLSHAPRVRAHIETNAPPAPRPSPLLANFRIGRESVLAHEGILDAFAMLLLRIGRDLAEI